MVGPDDLLLRRSLAIRLDLVSASASDQEFAFVGVVLFLLPMALDGGTHFISDLAGIGQGFRDSNLWLATLTDFAFAPSFYSGDALGSFNSWMRLITGLLAGVGLVWFAFPYIEEAFSD